MKKEKINSLLSYLHGFSDEELYKMKQKLSENMNTMQHCITCNCEKSPSFVMKLVWRYKRKLREFQRIKNYIAYQRKHENNLSFTKFAKEIWKEEIKRIKSKFVSKL